MTEKSLVPFIKNQFPTYLLESNSLFPDFMEAYYEWVSLEGGYARVGYDLETSTQIDKSFEKFSEEFISEYINDIPNDIVVDKVLLIKKISELYKAKGTPKAVKFLLKIISNVDSEIFLPSTQIFRPSAAKWNKDISVRFTLASGVISSFNNIAAQIVTPARTYDVDIIRIERVENTADQFEAFIALDFKIIIEDGGTIVTDTFVGNLVQTITKKTILNNGSQFLIGDVFEIVNGDGTGLKIKVSKVTATSGLKFFDIIEFGSGYDTSFIIDIQPKTVQGVVNTENFNIQLIDEFAVVQQNISYSTDDNISRMMDEITLVRFDYVDNINYFENNTYVGEILNTTTSETIAQADGESVACRVSFELGYVLEYPGYYSTNIGFPSDASYIQDGSYFQQFSYVVKSEVQYDEYQSAVNRIVHPAGMRMFGEYVINRELDILINVVNRLNKLETNIIDTINSVDVETKIVMKAVLEEITSADVHIKNLIKVLVDEPTAADVPTKTFTKDIDDLISIEDEIIFKNLNKMLEDEIDTFDFATKTYSKSIEDTPVSNDFGCVVFGEHYYEITEVQTYGGTYWECGYTTNETSFT